MSKPILVCQSLGKSFGDVVALESVDLTINSGQIIGLVGGNGAGKTTLLRLLAGVYRPSTGSVLTNEDKPVHTMRHILGVVPESTGLYHRMTAWENIRYHSRLHGVADDVAWQRTVEFAEPLGMSEALSRHTKGFSRGMRQKTALLRAIVHHPHLLLLDEPTAGLEVTSARAVRKLVQRLRDGGGTVIYSTHHLAEAQAICDEIIIIHNGQVRSQGKPEELMVGTETNSLEEAYVSLTEDEARQDSKDDEGWLTKAWKKLITPKTPKAAYSQASEPINEATGGEEE